MNRAAIACWIFLSCVLLSACGDIPHRKDATSIETSHYMPIAACDDARKAIDRAMRDAPGDGAASKAELAPAVEPFTADEKAAATALDRAASRAREIAIGLMVPSEPAKGGSGAAYGAITIKTEVEFSEMRQAAEAMQQGRLPALLLAGKSPVALYPLYFGEYFRHGHFLTVSLSSTEAKKVLRQQILAGLSLKEGDLSDDQRKMVDSTVDGLLKQVCNDAKCMLLDESGEGSFVNRAGQKFAFPTVAVSIVPGSRNGVEATKLDEIQVVGDLTRILLEASFDAIMWKAHLAPLASSKSTACVALRGDKPFTCVADADDAMQKELARLNLVADRTEGVAGSVAAKVVRGGWVASLNNEAVAKFLQTTISVSLRKGAEIVMAANRRHCGAKAEERVRLVTFQLTP